VKSRDSRLADVLGGPALAWLRARLRARLERGAALTGRLTLATPTSEERSAIERLIGRITRGRALHVDLDELATVLQEAQLSNDLAAAVMALEGPVSNRRAHEAEAAARWRAVMAETREALGSGSPWERWLADLEQTGLCRRLTGGDPEDGATLLAFAMAVLRRLPAEAVPLAELAASAVGDSHALDAGEPLATLVLRAVAIRQGMAVPEDADQRRAAWAAVGVLADELSAPALVLNLWAHAKNPTGRALSLAAEAGEPYRLSTRQLLRDPPSFDVAPGDVVFVCENPSVVAAAANRLGPRSRPLLCTEGQPKTALRLLLAQLRDAGFRIAYHGDFDWPGIQIGNAIVQRFGADAWRFSARDYLLAKAGTLLDGAAVAAAWDAALGEAMRARGRAVHEEAVVDDLVADLELADLDASPGAR
jgi:uncharacterized protein (TIGR02679 family)